MKPEWQFCQLFCNLLTGISSAIHSRSFSFAFIYPEADRITNLFAVVIYIHDIGSPVPPVLAAADINNRNTEKCTLTYTHTRISDQAF